MRRDALRRVGISVLLLGIVGLQLRAFRAASWNTWPFLPYPMYSTSFPAGPVERLDVKLVWTRESGASKRLLPSFGRSRYSFDLEIAEPLGRGSVEVAREVARRLNAGTEDRVERIRADVRTLRLAPGGTWTQRFSRHRFRFEYDAEGRIVAVDRAPRRWPAHLRPDPWIPERMRTTESSS